MEIGKNILHMCNEKNPAESKRGHLPKKWVKCQRAHKNVKVKVIIQRVSCVVSIDLESNSFQRYQIHGHILENVEDIGNFIHTPAPGGLYPPKNDASVSSTLLGQSIWNLRWSEVAWYSTCTRNLNEIVGHRFYRVLIRSAMSRFGLQNDPNREHHAPPFAFAQFCLACGMTLGDMVK